MLALGEEARKKIHGGFFFDYFQFVLKFNQIILGWGVELILFENYSVPGLYMHFLNYSSQKKKKNQINLHYATMRFYGLNCTEEKN